MALLSIIVVTFYCICVCVCVVSLLCDRISPVVSHLLMNKSSKSFNFVTFFYLNTQKQNRRKKNKQRKHIRTSRCVQGTQSELPSSRSSPKACSVGERHCTKHITHTAS